MVYVGLIELVVCQTIACFIIGFAFEMLQNINKLPTWRLKFKYFSWSIAFENVGIMLVFSGVVNFLIFLMLYWLN